MKLEDLGYTFFFEDAFRQNKTPEIKIARVIKEFKEQYVVINDEGEFSAEITGKLRFSAQCREDYPAVGDWVCITPYDDGYALIHEILPRISILERKAVNEYGEKQLMATNIDVAFIMQAVDYDFNLNRIERYISVVFSGKILPIILLSKIDLISQEELDEKINQIKERHHNVQVMSLSNISGEGITEIQKFMDTGKTYCILGSSGVGKSSLLNNLMGKEVLKVNQISDATHKGKHTTTHRELVILKSGGVLIDTPGMREIGLTDSIDGVEETFDDIHNLSLNCNFKDCTHDNEPGCAVLKAIDEKKLDEKKYQNYLKMKKEAIWFNSTVQEKRAKDKEFGKMVKNVMKHKKKKRF